jgi:hypothetical protein
MRYGPLPTTVHAQGIIRPSCDASHHTLITTYLVRTTALSRGSVGLPCRGLREDFIGYTL